MNILQFLIDIRARDSGVTGTLNRMQNNINRTEQAASNLERRMGGLRNAFLSLPGAEFLSNPIVALTAGIGIVSKLGMEAGKTATSFEVLVGDVGKAKSLLGDLNQYARDTIYDPAGVQEAAKTMLGFGVSVETVFGDLKMLGDVAGGNKQIMSQLALVYGQVAAAGKLQGQDLLQLINAGYNPLMDIAELTGKSMSEVRDEMSKGNISFDLMRQAFMRATGEGGRFYDMTNRIAQTPFGRFQQLVGEFTQKLLQLYAVIEPLLIPSFNLLSQSMQLLDPIIALLGGTISFLTENANWLLAILTPLAAGVLVFNGYIFVTQTLLKGWTIAQWAQVTAMIAAEKIQWLWNAAISANPIGAIIAVIAALASLVVYCWNKFAGFRAFILTMWDVLKGFGGIIKDYVVNRIQEFISGIGSLGKSLKALLSGDFKGAWNHAQDAAKGIVGVNAAKQAFRSGADLIGSTGDTYAAHLAREQAKQNAKETNKISTPTAAGGMGSTAIPTLGGGGGGGTGSNAGAQRAGNITAGGSRSTNVTVNIQKFFDSINVTMMDRADSGELQRIILECMNRAMEVALTTAR